MALGNGGNTVLETKEGGEARLYINKTGAPSIKGTLVNTEASEDFAVNVAGADEPDVMGIIYNDGVPDGGKVWVVTDGDADVLLEDSTASTRGYWARISITQAGRADITNAAPPGEGIPEAARHFKEIGHCQQSVIAGTDQLARVSLHFN